MSRTGMTAELLRQILKEHGKCVDELRRLRRVADGLFEIIEGTKKADPDLYDEVQSGFADSSVLDSLSEDDEDDIEESGESESKGRPTMPQALIAILKDRGSLTKLELRNELVARYPEIRQGNNHVYYYKTVRRMLNQGRLRTRGKKIGLGKTE